MTPHKWAKEIIHFVNGGEAESKQYLTSSWKRIYCVAMFDEPNIEVRIKPERVYPVTSLEGEQLHKIFNDSPGLFIGYTEIANAAIRQHIIDTERNSSE